MTTCPRCNQPVLFDGAGGLCPSCYEEALHDPDNHFVCECGQGFFRPMLAGWNDSRAQGICPYCGRKWENVE